MSFDNRDASSVKSHTEEVMSIDKLSNEVLLEIFALLDTNSLLNACLVCKSWDSLIGSSAATMNRFKLKFDPQRFEERIDGSVYRRKHVNVGISYGENFNGITEVITQSFDLSCVRNLQIYGYEAKLSEMMQFLSQMPLVQDIYFHPHSIFYDTAEDLKVVELSHLKNLNIDSVNCRVLKFFHAKFLSTLDINGCRIPGKIGIATLKNFLKSSQNLKTLKMNEGIVDGIFGHLEMPEFEFLLETFGMSYNFELESTTAKNLNSFLNSQLSLKALDLYAMKKITKSIFKTIVTKLKKLEYLSIDVTSTQGSFFEELTPNISVKELRLLEVFPSDASAKGFLKCFPCVEILDLDENIGEHLNYVAAYNQNLVELKIQSITTLIHDGLIFSKLKKLEVKDIKETNASISLIEKCPVLEDFTVQYLEKGSILRPEVELLLQQQNLKNLKFDGEFEDIKIIFDILKKNYGNLNKLVLIISEKSDYGTTKRADVTFEFPQDTSQWSIEEADAKFKYAWHHRKTFSA